MKTNFIIIALLSLFFKDSKQVKHLLPSTSFTQFQVFDRTDKVQEGTMREGLNKYIFYQFWDGSKWRANLEGLKFTIVNGVLINVSDPDFQHHGADDHNEEFISYLSDVKDQWWSKCHSHSEALTGHINFTFEHFRKGKVDADHEDEVMNIVDWYGNKWQISIPSRNASDKSPSPQKIEFFCRRIP
jgi:hypothetical protein